MAKDISVVWQDIDISTMPANIREAYEAFKVQQRKAAELRVEFENALNAHVKPAMPSGYKLIFGYRFGKLSAAMVEDEAKAKTPAKGAQSLKDFMAMQSAAGARN